MKKSSPARGGGPCEAWWRGPASSRDLAPGREPPPSAAARLPPPRERGGTSPPAPEPLPQQRSVSLTIARQARPMAALARRDDRLPGLDALRGIAALVVLVGHAGALYNLYEIPGGLFAVDFFFMLSGYVLARSYEHAFGNGLSPAVFVWKRYKRLWPLCALGTALLVVPALAWPQGWQVAVLNLLLLPSFAYAAAYPINPPLWSIFFELVANAVHAVFLYRARLVTVIVVLALICAGLAWRTETYNLGSAAGNFPAGVFRVLLPYSIGVLLWRTWRDRPPIAPPPRSQLGWRCRWRSPSSRSCRADLAACFWCCWCVRCSSRGALPGPRAVPVPSRAPCRSLSM